MQTQNHEAAGWLWMWGIAVSIYAFSKAASWHVATSKAPAIRQTLFLVVWPGMDADTFLSGSHVKLPRFSEWLRGGVCLISGLLLVNYVIPEFHSSPGIAGACGMTAILLILHFGVFLWLSCVLRVCGIDARPLMNSPIHSASVSEFWGRRWNSAFRDLTHRFVFRPLSRLFGPRNALLTGFLVSGIIHDIVISGPAGGGWGCPTLYFAIQGLAILTEKTRWAHKQIVGNEIIGRLFTALVVMGPVGLLFHGPFLRNVITPFFNSMGAIL